MSLEDDGHVTTHRPLSSSLSGVQYRILNINHNKELLRGLWGAMTASSTRQTGQ